MPLHTITTTDAEGVPVVVEAYVGVGLPGFTVINAPLSTDRERRDRLRAAVLNSGLDWPESRITVNVAPVLSGRRHYSDAGLDLAMAVGILAAAGDPRAALITSAPRAELGLDGCVDLLDLA